MPKTPATKATSKTKAKSTKAKSTKAKATKAKSTKAKRPARGAAAKLSELERIHGLRTGTKD